uniref:ATP synthase F0 subunit 6 n=1 Tax=Palaemon macrodactylus TaxID=390956 RepID=UPI0024359E80|nr:ATP synthase F0 subunit 6 [Palaemon macrodactylus]QLM05132.1 ATP synthase F0 subunit 6 [Palaemon macrodactylus]WEW73443.1 ATP synthase F0 subunit 6 [Palaemon macrodactylus]
MMTNLFSSFDPLSSISNLPLNWISTLLGLMFIPYLFWAMPSRASLMWSSLMMTLHKEFKILLGPTNLGGTLIFNSLFSLIMFNNFLGLMPYIFTSTSHLAMTLSLALPLWLTSMVFGWINHTKHMFAHLVPAGTPGPLTPLMVLIETVSNIIRPGTLAIRLAANMIAGHLLLTLLGNTGSNLSKTLLSFLLLSQILLLILESAVAIIQSYVFAALTTLYTSEVN